MRLSPTPITYGVDPWSNETVQQLPLGSIGYSIVGNMYRYALVGAAPFVPGNIYQQAAIDTAFVDLAVQTAAPLRTSGVAPAFNSSVALTLGASPTTLYQFVGGRAVVSTGTGIGTQYTIANHTVTAAAGIATFTFEEQIYVALTTSSKMTLIRNPYYNNVISPIAPTGFTTGIAITAAPAGTYTWLGTHGVFGALSDATLGAVGNGISPSTTTAGSITKAVTLKDSIGYFIVTPVSAQVEPEWFNIN